MVLFLILLLSRAIFGLSERQLRLRAVLRMAKERAGVFSDIVGSLNLLRASLVQAPCSGRLKKKKQTLLASYYQTCVHIDSCESQEC